MRPKRRYIAFEVEGEAGGNEIWEAIDGELRVRVPTIDRTLLKLILYDKDMKRGLLRCAHKQVGELKGVISDIEKCGIRLKILGVSGTIRGATKKFWS